MEQAVQKKEDSLSSTTAQRLRDAGLEKELSLWELSRRAGISQPQISLLENGKYQLKRKAGEKLAEALHVGVVWMISGDEQKRLYPADKKMIDWLWEHPEEREEFWKKIEVFWKELNGESRRNKMPCEILRLSAAEQRFYEFFWGEGR